MVYRYGTCRLCESTEPRPAAEFYHTARCSKCGGVLDGKGFAPNPGTKSHRRNKKRGGKKRLTHTVASERFVVTRDTYPQYLASRHWKRTKARKERTAGHKCERCRSDGRLQVHHKHYRTLWAETDADLETLCRVCHERCHGTELANLNHIRSIV